MLQALALLSLSAACLPAYEQLTLKEGVVADQGADLFGDPLPPGAIARLGTVRLRHSGVWSVRFSPDGKLLASAGGDGLVRVWDVASGKELRRLAGHEQTGPYCAVFSPDNKLLASGDFSHVHLWDVATGRKIRAMDGFAGVKDRKNSSSILDLAFLEGGNVLAASVGVLGARLWETATGKDRGFIKHPFMEGDLHFQHVAGEYLVATSPYGSVRFWNPTDQKKIRMKVIKLGPDNQYTFRLALSPDGKTLLVGTDRYIKQGMLDDRREGRVALWDLAGGKEIRHWDLAQRIAGVAFSPDGRTLAFSDMQRTIHIWDVGGHREIRRMASAPAYGLNPLVFSPDSKTMASMGWNAIHLWDLSTGRERFDHPGHDARVNAVSFTRGDKTLVSGCSAEGAAGVWNLATGRQQLLLAGKWGDFAAIAFTSTGAAVTATRVGDIIQLWDTKAGTKLHDFFIEPGQRREDREIAVMGLGHHDTRLVSVSVSVDKTITVVAWDIASEKELIRRRGPNPSFEPDSYTIALSPDGGLVAEADNRSLAISDLSQGRKKLHLPLQLEEGETLGKNMLLTPHNRTLILQTFVKGKDEVPDNRIRVLELASGKELFAWKSSFGWQGVLSPDGRTLAATESKDRLVRLWDMTTGRQSGHLHEPFVSAASMAFSHNGKILATGMANSTVVLWDLARVLKQAQPPPKILAPEQLDLLWKDLSAGDARRAYAAVWALAAASDQAINVLNRRVRPVQATDAKRISRLIADLNSDHFQTRAKAMTELEGLGDLAEPALRRATTGNLALENRRRIEQLLSKLHGPITDPDQLRTVRAVQVLEYIGTPNARQVLATWSRGTPDARLTREAKASLNRLR
jgi:WD40 repeat protein